MMKKALVLLSLCFFTWYSNAQSQQNFPELENLFESEELNNFSPFETNPPFEKEELGGISDILPPDAAFIFSSYLESSSMLVAHWQIADNYYLYRDQFQFTLKGGGILGAPQFPPGKIIDDVKYGRVEIYEQTLSIKLPIVDAQGLDTLTLETSYQGCADGRLCYPPIQKSALVTLEETPQLSQAIEADDAELAELAKLMDGLIPENRGTQFGEKVEFLKVDEAFILSAEFSDPSHLVVRWKIADGYYLYQDKLNFSLESEGKLGTPQLPPSTLKPDPYFGDAQIYLSPQLEIILPIQIAQLKTVALKVKYQGCANAGLCYPPTTKVVNLSFPSNGISEQDRLANLLADAHILYTIMVFFGLGILLSLTPCVFPMIPILSSIIVGQGKQVTTYKAFIMSLVYVLAMACTYAIVGVLTGLLGENLSAAFQNPWILISFALVFVVLSFSMFGFYELQLPSGLQTKLTHFSNRQQGGTLIGVAIMGVLSALIVGPCVAAPLVGALIYISQTGDAVLGGLALFFMSLGMGIPLIIIGISAGHWLPKANKWMNTVKAVFGVLLLAVAIWMLERVIPGQITMLLWASLLIISAVYIGALDKLDSKVSGWHKLWKGLGFILLVYGVLLIIGAASGNVNPLQPLQNLKIGDQTTDSSVVQVSPFKAIKGVEGLERELAVAKAQNKQVILDFYADWCISCKEMEHLTLSDPGVQKILAHFVLLQADVTPNDKQDKALYKRFGIFGPPAILFFDTNGLEQQAYRVVGFMQAEAFRQHLQKIVQL